MSFRGGFALIGLLLATVPAAQAEQWGEWWSEYDEGGVTLEVRKNRDTGVVQTRAVATLSCSPDELWDRITHSESYLELMPGALESNHLQESEGELVVYQRMDGSPSNDRDYTLRVVWTREQTERGPRYHREWKIDNGAGPGPREGVVRVEVNNGFWELIPTARGGTSFEYVNYIELGGSLWNMFANGAAQDSARDFVLNLQEMCRGR